MFSGTSRSARTFTSTAPRLHPDEIAGCELLLSHRWRALCRHAQGPSRAGMSSSRRGRLTRRRNFAKGVAGSIATWPFATPVQFAIETSNRSTRSRIKLCDLEDQFSSHMSSLDQLMRAHRVLQRKHIDRRYVDQASINQSGDLPHRVPSSFKVDDRSKSCGRLFARLPGDCIQYCRLRSR